MRIDRVLQQSRKPDEHLVAGRMSAGIVDDLELVEVDVQQGMPGLRRRLVFDQLHQLALERKPVQHAGQRIMHRHEIDLFLGPFAAGDVLGDACDLDDLALLIDDRIGTRKDPIVGMHRLEPGQRIGIQLFALAPPYPLIGRADVVHSVPVGRADPEHLVDVLGQLAEAQLAVGQFLRALNHLAPDQVIRQREHHQQPRDHRAQVDQPRRQLCPSRRAEPFRQGAVVGRCRVLLLGREMTIDRRQQRGVPALRRSKTDFHGIEHHAGFDHVVLGAVQQADDAVDHRRIGVAGLRGRKRVEVRRHLDRFELESEFVHQLTEHAAVNAARHHRHPFPLQVRQRGNRDRWIAVHNAPVVDQCLGREIELLRPLCGVRDTDKQVDLARLELRQHVLPGAVDVIERQ